VQIIITCRGGVRIPEKDQPKWAQEIARFVSVKPQFLLWGNVYDKYPKEKDSLIVNYTLTDYLKHLLSEEEYSAVVLYEPVNGFTLLDGKPEEIKEICGETIINKPRTDTPPEYTTKHIGSIIEKLVLNTTKRVAILLNFASRIPGCSADETEKFYYTLFRLCQMAEPRMPSGSNSLKYNAIFWILDKENDIPAWYTLDNSKLKIIPLPKPDYQVRKRIIETLSKDISGYPDLDEKKRNTCISIFIDQTSGLHVQEIISIVSLAKKENVPFKDIAEAIRRYKIGIVENPWSKLDLKKIGRADEILEIRVLGQPVAIKKASDIIKRSVFSLSGSQYSRYSNRPKGVLFFAGPTGVGKTELAKGITEMIFGSDTSYIRFDMTEFKESNADQRLIGAPPGYLGFDIGGELTNKIKQNPFSVILFDEIEKANPRIFDIFMQMLDDGRLTSGRGETVYFSEALIIFTSNLGIYDIDPVTDEKRVLVDDKMNYPDIEATIKKEIENFFKFKLSPPRPEILNRIGENIIVFDFIRPEISDKIYDKMMQSVLDTLKETHRISLSIDPSVTDTMKQEVCRDLSMGGRGIGNHIEQIFINPLSRALFREGITDGDYIRVTGVHNEGSEWELTISKDHQNEK